jgi:hypothetical protein
MAMLLLNDVFARTWGERVGPPPEREYWSEVIEAVRARHPGLLFIAEAYWDLEWRLQQLGFDHCYDKRLYDELVTGGPSELRAHVGAGIDYQSRLVRFTENHDEPRAATTFAPADRERAVAVVTATLPGATLWHDGQFEGRRTHVPVHLRRRPDEPLDDDLRRFHLALVAAAAGQLRSGTWAPCPTTHDHLLAWCWTGPDDRPHSLVVVNHADEPATGRVQLPWPHLSGQAWNLHDPLADQTFLRAGDELATDGLYVDLAPWASHTLTCTPAGPGAP